MGIFPIWGFQLLIGIPLAMLFKMNKVLFIASANVSIPPMIPVIIFVSYFFGSFFVTDGTTFPALSDITLDTIHLNFIQYVIGAVVFALVAALVSFGTSYLLLNKLRKRQVG